MTNLLLKYNKKNYLNKKLTEFNTSILKDSCDSQLRKSAVHFLALKTTVGTIT